MKKKILYSALIAGLIFLTLLPVSAQKLYKGAILISNCTLWQEGDSLYINLTADISHLKIGKDRTLTLIPVLTSAQNKRALQEIVINGSRREKVYLRAMSLNKAIGLQMPNDDTDRFNYSQVIHYQPWMANASLYLKENLCGCAGHREMLKQEPITAEMSTEESRMNNLQPIVVYIKPEIERIKARNEQYKSHLTFPVNQSVILPKFNNNLVELTNIQSMFSKIKEDKNLTVTGVRIEGYASPEGTLKQNEALSKSRTEALKDYLITHERISANLYATSFGGENWDGLIQALKASDLQQKERFLQIIQNTSNDVSRKQEIMRVENGVPYRAMLKELYPPLRIVDCRINYTVASFDVTQGRIIIQTQPKYLSLNEMYQVANSYPIGSDDFNRIFGTAVQMYPDDEVANLNAAAVSLSKKNKENARRQLSKANKQTAEYDNNNGVLCLLDGNFSLALKAFRQAASKGSEAAKKNMELLEKMRVTKKRGN